MAVLKFSWSMNLVRVNSFCWGSKAGPSWMLVLLYCFMAYKFDKILTRLIVVAIVVFCACGVFTTDQLQDCC